MAESKQSHSRGDPALLAIAVFKLVKGGLILAFACGAMSFFHKDVASQVQHWLDQLRVDPDNRFVGALLTKLQLVDTKHLKEISAISAGYAAISHRGHGPALAEALGRVANDHCDGLVYPAGNL